MTGGGWFDRAFGPLYGEVYAHRDEAEADAQVAWASASERLGLDVAPPGAAVLDLACGAGRHLRALRRRSGDRDLRLVGLDRSRTLLEEARRSGASDLHSVRGDMRHLPFAANSFLAVMQWFTAFGYFEAREQDVEVLAEIARVLRPGGRHLLDTLSAEHVRATLVPEGRREVAGGVVHERRWIEGDRVCKELRYEARGASGQGEGSRPPEVWTESVRLWEGADLEAAARRVGLEPLARFGSTDGAPEGSGSRLVLLSERRA